MQTKKLLDGNKEESVFKCVIVFNYKSKFNPMFDAMHRMYSKDYLLERYGKPLNLTEYTAYHHIKTFLTILCTKNQLKVAELYWNTDGKKYETPNNYICSFKPVGAYQGIQEYYNPGKPKLIVQRPSELIKSYAQFQQEMKLIASQKRSSI